MAVRIERLPGVRNKLGEGPLWDAEGGFLYWVDTSGQAVSRLDHRSGKFDRRTLPKMIGSLALRRSGGLVLALHDGFYTFDFDSGSLDELAIPSDMDPSKARFNDGKVDRNGAFVAGTMLRPGETRPVGVLYRLNPDLSIDALERDILLSNGPSFSKDGKTLYFADSLRLQISAYDYGQKLENKRLFFDASSLGSMPDGSTVDAEGYLWTALIKTAQVGRIAPDGSIDRLVDVPCKYPTSVAFGGPDLDTLYVTSVATSESGRFEDDSPNGGGMFAITGLAAQGIEEPRFAG